MAFQSRLMSTYRSTVISFRSRWSPVVLQERRLPTQIKPTQLLIQVSHIALNPIDIKLKSIGYLPISQQSGKEFSGTIEKVGDMLTSQYKCGERVSVTLTNPFEGTVGTTALIDASKHAVVKTPSRLSDAEAAAFPVGFGTAFTMLDRTPKKGKLLVLGGASTVGTHAIQLAKKYFDFDTVVATCSTSSKDFVTDIGADQTVDYRSKDVSGQLVRLGIKFDAIVDTVGGYDALRVWPKILKSYTEGGVYVSNAGDQPPSRRYSNSFLRPTLLSLPWLVPRLLFGQYFGINYQLATITPGEWTQVAPEFLARQDVIIPIDSVFPMRDVQKAWNKVDSLGARGKVLVMTSPQDPDRDQNT